MCPYSALITITIIWYMAFFFAFEMSESGDSPMKGMASPSLGAILGYYFGIFCIALKVSVAGHL